MTVQIKDQVAWSDIDKSRFFCIGTAMYTAITLTLHPITVLKTRQQVLTSPHKLQNIRLINTMKTYYRGVGIVLVSAIPARSIYIGVLENSKEIVSSKLISNKKSSLFTSLDEKSQLSLIASISGGISGGCAAMASQTIVVPMDVISQRQMVMDSSLYETEGGALNIIKNVIKTDGFAGFYRGFGMSLFTSLPGGTLWWATYSGCHQVLQNFEFNNSSKHENDNQLPPRHFNDMIRRGINQGVAGLSAAIVAASLTQPLDVIKTRLQVATDSQTKTYGVICEDLLHSHGLQGFFRGVSPRILSMAIWGTALSSAYEYLRHVSRKDYDFSSNQWIKKITSRPIYS
jgi:solute carrier family 25 protein 44